MIADTHLPRGGRRLPAECVRRVRASGLVVHAGDFCTAAVHEQIAALGPELIAVRGNIDDAPLRARLPERTVIERLGVRIAVIHDAGPARARPARLRRAFPGVDAVVFGHSHMALHERDEDGFQIFNPGSPTERRRSPAHTMGVATIAAGAVHFRHFEL